MGFARGLCERFWGFMARSIRPKPSKQLGIQKGQARGLSLRVMAAGNDEAAVGMCGVIRAIRAIRVIRDSDTAGWGWERTDR